VLEELERLMIQEVVCDEPTMAGKARCRWKESSEGDDTKRVYHWWTEEEVGIGEALTETLLCRVVCQEFSWQCVPCGGLRQTRRIGNWSVFNKDVRINFYSTINRCGMKM
jgi:hypothetical protein